MFASIDNPKLHPKHTAFVIASNANESVTGVRGQPLIIEDIEAFVVFKEDVKQPESLLQLIADKKVMLINDGKGIK